MASSTLLLLALSFIAHQVLTANAVSKQPLAPAVYVFGDSTVDAGNNNHLNTKARADKWPYGIDFNNVTGRFSNGKNGADFIATYLGLPLPPAYLNLSDYERSQITTGINYASGACGILNTTRAGECLSLEQQVEYFNLTATKDLPKAINDQRELQTQLANSIYLLLIGNNDYISPVNGNIMDKYTPEDFANFLIDEITKHITELYDIGARKFLVSGISICKPYTYAKPCESRYYADKLPGSLEKLRNELSGSLFTMYDGFNTYKNVFENPGNFGFTNINQPCYEPGKPICPDRSKYNQFDRFGHQTEASQEIASRDCFNGTACYPFTLFDLANATVAWTPSK